LLEDELPICVNAWWETVTFTIPTQDIGMTWSVLVDAAKSTAGNPPGEAGLGQPLSNGNLITVGGRSLVVMSGQP